MEKLPNLFVVGSAKSGTTALYVYFRQHPDIFVPESIKELYYMAFYAGQPEFTGPGDKASYAMKGASSLEAYLDFFGAENGQKIRADVSPAYLVYPQASRKIAELCPKAKIVIILRNPVECAFSMFSMMRRDGREPCHSFQEAFMRSEERRLAGWEWSWDYHKCFLFFEQVRRYLELFPREQIYICRYEELKNDPENFYRNLTAFIDIPPIDRAGGNIRTNESPRQMDVLSKHRGGRLILNIINAYRKSPFTKIVPPKMRGKVFRAILEKPIYRLTPKDRKFLLGFYGEDIQKLGAMLQWDISDWLKI